MGRILGIDYGKKRCGLAATDPLQIIVNSVDTIPTNELKTYILKYCTREEVDKIVLGYPTHKDGTETDLVKDIKNFEAFILKLFPDILVDYQDESFSSVHAVQIIRQSGAKKKKRQDKSLIDKVSAVVILQRYLKHI